MTNWEIAGVLATVVMMVLTAISAGVAWDAHTKSIRAANDANTSADRAQAASDRANESRDEANRLRNEANVTANAALAQAERSNETARSALEQAREANDHRRGIRDIEQARFDEEQEQKRFERSANLRCDHRGGESSHQSVTSRFIVSNDGPATAERVRHWVERNGLPWASEPSPPTRLFPRIDSQIEVKITPRLAEFRSAIPGDVYRIIVTYQDGNDPQAVAIWCVTWEGEGNPDRPGDLRATIERC